jgi:hypothetical protein
MADQTDVELQIEIARARSDWAREKRQHEVRREIAEIDEQRAALRRCDQSLARGRELLVAELQHSPQERVEPIPRVVQQGPRYPTKVANSE